MFKKLVSVFLCLVLLTGVLSIGFTAHAANIIEKGILTVDTVDGPAGESVYVSLKFTENPGLMGVSISVNYDPTVLTLEEHKMGDILSDCMLNNRVDKKYIRLVSLDFFEKKNDGTLITFKFKVAEDVAAKALSPITVTYNRGDFCNQEIQPIMPTVVSGGVNVIPKPKKECEHKEYGEWKIAAPATCEVEGVEQRLCTECGHSETKAIAALGHNYSDEWTVDTPATAEKDGTMSRYCTRCDSYVDRVTFSLEQTENNKIDNTFGSTQNDKEYAEEIFKEQNPDKELTPAGSQPSAPTDATDSTDSADSDISSKNGDKAEPSDSTGLIVGIVIAVVAIIAIALLIIKKKK